MEDLTGKQLGPYQIVEPLGEGGMASVYKAYQPSMDRYVALKVLPRHFSNDPEFISRFSQEARVIANLQHPHILPVHDFGEADGYTYLTMRFIEGGTLADWLKNNGPLALERIRHIIAQVGGALDYAHAQGVVHRDIKPSNILVDRWDNCLLTDFGLAKIASSAAHLTQTGGILGTPAYMSPEQGLGQKIDGRSDIYSLGVVLYQMAIGRLPYQAETPMAVVIKHIHDPLPPPHQFNPDLPDGVERVILKALSKTPEDRFETAGEMVKMLQSATERPTVIRSKSPSLPEPVAAETAVAPPTIAPQPKPEPEIEPTIVAEPAGIAAPMPTTPKKRRKRPFFKRPLFYIGLGLIAVIILGVLISGGGDGDGAPDASLEAGSVDELMDIMDEAYANDDLELALTAVSQAIDMEPDQADLYCQRGYVLRDLEAHEEAVDAFDECRQLAKEQQNSDLQFNAFGQMTLSEVNRVMVETDDTANALAVFDAALQEPEAPPWLICERGEYNIWYDNPDAIADFEVCRDKTQGDDYWPWRADSVINMLSGYDALDQEDYPRAVEHFSRWAELNPDDPWAFCALGDAHAALDEFQPALDNYTRCHDRAVGDEDLQNSAQSSAWYVQGRMADSDGMMERAVEFYSQAIELTPDENGWLFCERGQSYQDLGRLDEARGDYESCLESDDPGARDWAEELLHSLESPES